MGQKKNKKINVYNLFYPYRRTPGTAGLAVPGGGWSGQIQRGAEDCFSSLVRSSPNWMVMQVAMIRAKV